MDERRKSRRLTIPLNVEVIASEQSKDYVLGETRDFSQEGFSFESKDVELETNKTIVARFRLLPESRHVYVRGRVVWKIQIGDECQTGVQIDEIETEVDSEELGYPFDMWTDKIKR